MTLAENGPKLPRSSGGTVMTGIPGNGASVSCGTIATLAAEGSM
jgi:hypothetical protein